MPVWHELTRAWREKGELVMVGITQEQHPDRCRLFAQWKEFDWPILWDPFNLTGSGAVPLAVAVDEHGIVRKVNPRPANLEAEFLALAFPAPPEPLSAQKDTAERLLQLGGLEPESFEAVYYAALSDLLWKGELALDEGLATLERLAGERPEDGRLAFRAGVARRLRYDSALSQPQDFQLALDHWRRALDIDPNQYIWRRRIQQYGPRMDKPYPFYSWVREAQESLRARGVEPVAIDAQLTPAELAQPRGSFGEAEERTPPDPEGRIIRDEVGGFVTVETAVAFETSGKAPVASVHVAFRPNVVRKAHWNNEAGPMQVWIEAGDGAADWKLAENLFEHRDTTSEVSDDVRRFTAEVGLPAASGEAGSLRGYALFYACEDVDGVCVFLRKDFEITIQPPG